MSRLKYNPGAEGLSQTWSRFSRKELCIDPRNSIRPAAPGKVQSSRNPGCLILCLTLACLILDDCNKPKPVKVLTPSHEKKVIEVLQSAGLRENGDIAGAASWSAGEDLGVWYRDEGSRILLVTRSGGRVSVHVDFNRNGTQDKDQDRVYTVAGDGTITSQSDRPTWASAAWGELKTTGSVNVRNRGESSNVILWRLPKSELGLLQDGSDLTFEVFDQHTQTSKFWPGLPFESVVRLKYTKSVGDGPSGKIEAPVPAVKVPEEGRVNSAPVRVPATSPAVSVVPPTISKFRAEPGSVERGGAASLQWATSNATGVTIEPGLGGFPPQGDKVLSPAQTVAYTLTARGPGGTASATLAIVVVDTPAPTITTFQADSGSIQRGASTILRWAVSGRTTSVRIDQGLGTLPTQGSREVSPERTTTYTLTADGPGGSASNQFTVIASVPPRPSITFDADSRTITQGQTTTLRWNVTGASRVSIAPSIGSVDANGSATVRPSASGPFTLTADGPGGTASRSVAISVIRASASSGELVWTGNIQGSRLITIDKAHANEGSLQGALPGAPCVIDPMDKKHVSVVSSPAPVNNYERLVLSVTGKGMTRVIIKWSLL